MAQVVSIFTLVKTFLSQKKTKGVYSAVNYKGATMGIQWAGVGELVTRVYSYITSTHGTQSQPIVGRGMDTDFANLLLTEQQGKR